MEKKDIRTDEKPPERVNVMNYVTCPNCYCEKCMKHYDEEKR